MRNHTVFKLAATILRRALMCALAMFGLFFAALWARSYRAGDFFGYDRNVVVGPEVICDRYSLATGNGVLMVGARRGTLDWPRVALRPDGLITDFPLGRHFRWTRQRPDGLPDMGWSRSFLGRRGFVWFSPPRNSNWHLGLPAWVPVIVFGLAPLLWGTSQVWSVLRVRRRWRRGLCLVCGYDMRGGQGRCPECGASRLASASRPGRAVPRVAWTLAALAIVAAFGTFALMPWSGGAASLAVSRGGAPDAASRPTTGLVEPRAGAGTTTTSDVPASQPFHRRRSSLPGAEYWRFTTQQLERATADLDPSRTYIFLRVSNPAAADRSQHVSFFLFAWQDGHWRMRMVQRGPGDVVGDTRIAYPLKVGTMDLDEEGDLKVTLTDGDGRVVETRSALDDRADPTNMALINLASNIWYRPK